jgi:hypothetical protein
MPPVVVCAEAALAIVRKLKMMATIALHPRITTSYFVPENDD